MSTVENEVNGVTSATDPTKKADEKNDVKKELVIEIVVDAIVTGLGIFLVIMVSCALLRSYSNPNRDAQIILLTLILEIGIASFLYGMGLMIISCVKYALSQSSNYLMNESIPNSRVLEIESARQVPTVQANEF